jgi:hypothetical protein
MANGDKEPDVKELLARIRRLEAANLRLDERLRAVTLEHNDLSTAFAAELNSSVKHHRNLCREISELYELVWPLVQKVLPNVVRAQQRVEKITKPQPTEGK